MIAYVTYNDPPSGIFLSQVVDVVKHYRSMGESIILISFVSLRSYKKDKKRLKEMEPEAIVLPCFPGVKNWKYSLSLLKFYLKKNKVQVGIGRGVFAADLLLRANLKRTVFDARGAYFGEWSEFKFGANDNFIKSIYQLEKKVLLYSDFKIAVSNALTQYWKETYNLNIVESEVAVIPCTLSNTFKNFNLDIDEIKTKRKALGYSEDDIVLVYSGSIAGWQSIDYWLSKVEALMKGDSKVKLLLLSRSNEVIDEFISKYPEKVQRHWVKPEEVSQLLSVADYGILIREKMITNRVASPTKFAEYLSVGLHVLISRELGDFSNLVEDKKLGQIVDDQNNMIVNQLSFLQKKDSFTLAKKKFTKDNFTLEYLKVIGK